MYTAFRQNRATRAERRKIRLGELFSQLILVRFRTVYEYKLVLGMTPCERAEALVRAAKELATKKKS